MPVIKIDFFKIGCKVTTWMTDEEWESLDGPEKKRLIEAYVKKHYQNELGISKAREIEPVGKEYRWGKM